MCGRFTLRQTGDAIAQQFHLLETPRLEPRYNIAPTQPAPVVLLDGKGDRRFTYLYWGLIPSWSKDPSMGARMINARAETVAEKPAFRTAFKRRRCLVVADGFYEWKQTGKKKQPYYFRLADDRPFAIAGLWEHWESADGEIDSCTLITTEPNQLLEFVHDRMPVILDEKDYDLWLDPTMQQTDRLQPLLRPYRAEAMSHYPVSLAVNNPKHDAADCMEAIPSPV